MFGNIWDRKTDPEPAERATAAGVKSDGARATHAGKPRTSAAGAGPGPAPSPGANRRQAIVNPSKTGVPVAKQLDMLKQRTPGVATSKKQETDAMANKESQRLVVGARIHLKGEVTKCDALIVEGHVEGSANSRVIQVAKDGTFDGEAEAEIAEISGKFDGTLAVSDKLIVRSTGQVSGTIRYCGVEIEAGGQISGDVQVTTTDRPPVSKPASESAHHVEAARGVNLAS
jgi:cytoskeletal protein CcmA (bactofilin family)